MELKPFPPMNVNRPTPAFASKALQFIVADYRLGRFDAEHGCNEFDYPGDLPGTMERAFLFAHEADRRYGR